MNGSDVLARALLDAGVARVFGAHVPGVSHVPVADPLVAGLLAGADGRIHLRPGAALHPDGTLVLSSAPGVQHVAEEVTEPAALPGAVQRAAQATIPAATTRVLQVGFDLAAPFVGPRRPVVVGRHVPPSATTLPRTGRLAVLAGPGVVRRGAVAALARVAAAGPLGVANTWGAKGVFRWDSPHHMGTVGLQARDFELLGFAGADAIITTGVDPDEAAAHRHALAPLCPVAPEHLAWYADDFDGRVTPLDNHLYDALASVAQPGYTDERVPLHPARVARDTRDALGDAGMVAADAGAAGLWVARTFPTVALGSVIVPAVRAPGAAAALACVAALDGRPAVAMTAAPLDAATDRVIEVARGLGARFTVVAWADGASTGASIGGATATITAAADYATLLAAALATDGVSVLEVPVDLGCTNDLVAAAGEVVAWGGI